MTAQTKPAPTELGIYADQLRDAITLVKPFIGGEDTLPMLCGYRFEVRGGDLYVWGTDRYTLAVVRVAPRDEQSFPAGFSVFVPAGLAARALAMFKPGRGTFPPVPLKVSTHGKWTAIENVPYGEDEPAARLTGEVIGEIKPLGTFTMCTQAIDAWREGQKSTEPEPAPTVGLNPVFTARIAIVEKVLGRGQHVVMRAGAHNKPIMFTAGDDFFVMQMPVRLHDEQTDLDTWAERFAEPKPVEKPAAKPRARKAPAKKAAPKKATRRSRVA